MKRFLQRSAIRTWLYSGLFLSCTAIPGWSQEVDPFDNGLEDFPSLPAPIGPDDEVPAPFADIEHNAAMLEGSPELSDLTPQQGNYLKQSAIERQRSFFDAANGANDSLKLARDVFERGLMPLSDYVEQTQAALEIKLSIAGLQQDRKAKISALSEHADLMRNAAKQLREFDQPASTGWEADTAQAELMVANADLRLAAARGDRKAYVAAVDRSRELAQRYYELRAADYDQGLASLPSLARAASYLPTETGQSTDNRPTPATEPTKFAEFLEKLEDVADQTTQAAEDGAEFGRDDRVHQAQFELAKASGLAALRQQDAAGVKSAFSQAADSSQAWFAAQADYYESGTASLREVTQAWWNRIELSDLAQRAGLKPDASMAADTEADLRELKKLVAATEDRQGRIAADVAHLKSLENLQGLWAREQAVAALNRSQAGKAPVAPRKSARVLELKKSESPAPMPEGTEPAPKTIEGTTPVTVEKTPQTTIEIIKPKRAPKK